ncbi:peptide deformylase [Thermoleophilum album]|uniref:Peptide deformylase n=1 Tax=Thermoleophilum album TaxID=29539 RepID=A0A1H6FY78_THEAL|nr:peptide deformylase [Thermoleophilum album]
MSGRAGVESTTVSRTLADVPTDRTTSLGEACERPPGRLEGELREPQQLDPETAARRRRALARIRQYGDPILRSRATPVARFDNELRRQAQEMIELMRDALGIGLAAPQAGLSQRLLVYQIDEESEARVLVNPELVWHSEELEVAEEGCLSLPGVLLEVERPLAIRVVAQQLDGAAIELEASGLEARVIQHELDHLDGILILDRVPRDQRRAALRALREALERPAAGADVVLSSPAAASDSSSPRDQSSPVTASD